MNLELRLRGSKWYVVGSVLVNGSRIPVRQSTGYNSAYKNLAANRLQEITRDVLAGNFNSANVKGKERVSQAIDLYLHRPEGVGKTDVSILSRFGREFDHVKLESLSVADIQLYVQARGNKASTVRRELNSIMAMLNHASSMGWRVSDLSKLKKPRADDERCRWLTEEERELLIAACEPDELRHVVTFLFFTGARLGEALKLKWGDVIVDTATLSTKKGKQKKRRLRNVPLVERAIAAMGQRGKRSDYVFLAPTGKPWTKDALYKYFNPAKERAGVEDFTPHDCRHTFASHLVQKGATLKAVADLLGHKNLNMVMRYAHLSPTHLKTTVEMLG